MKKKVKVKKKVKEEESENEEESESENEVESEKELKIVKFIFFSFIILMETHLVNNTFDRIIALLLGINNFNILGFIYYITFILLLFKLNRYHNIIVF
jgi:hypothetical protein